VAHFSGTHNAFLSEGEALTVVVGALPGKPYWKGVGADSPRRLRKGEARLRFACSPLARRNGAPHERGAGGESDPTLFCAGAPPGRIKGDRENDTLSLPFLGRSHHSDPWREGHRVLLRPAALNSRRPGSRPSHP